MAAQESSEPLDEPRTWLAAAVAERDLGARDREKLAQYVDAIRDVERRIQRAEEQSARELPVVTSEQIDPTPTLERVAEAIRLTASAKRAGADGALMVAPYYNKPTQEGMYLHFKAVAEESGIPIVIYNVPARTVTDISVETLARLGYKVPQSRVAPEMFRIWKPVLRTVG